MGNQVFHPRRTRRAQRRLCGARRAYGLVAYHYGPHVIALTHRVVLGFVSSVVIAGLIVYAIELAETD